jgi:hypothetical protein
MTTDAAAQVILHRFHEKCRTAGGPRAGYVLRRKAILHVQGRHPDLDFESGLDALVQEGLLKVSEEGTFFFLTAAGVEKLNEVSSS